MFHPMDIDVTITKLNRWLEFFVLVYSAQLNFYLAKWSKEKSEETSRSNYDSRNLERRGQNSRFTIHDSERSSRELRM